MKALDFVAVDVETANSSRGSICCIGIAEVRAGEVVRVDQWMTAPPPGLHEFYDRNVSIHGIRPQDVKDAPSFEERLGMLLARIGDLDVLAHNASFEASAFKAACRQLGLPDPAWRLACSMQLAKSLISSESYGLGELSRKFGIQLDHHHAGSDAEACARLTLRLAEISGAESIDDLLAPLQKPRRTSSSGPGTSWIASHYRPDPEPPDANVDADIDHPLYGKTVVLTGTLMVNRGRAWELIAEVGGIPEDRLTRRTDILVCGLEARDMGIPSSRKHAKALEWQSSGRRIEIIDESALMRLIGDSYEREAMDDDEAWLQ